MRPSTTRPDPAPVPRWAMAFFVLVIAMATALLLTRPAPAPTVGVLHSRWAASTTPATARFRLARFAEVREAPEVAYDRIRDFGPAWSDVDHNGCDTRNDILRRDLTEVRFRPGTGRCVVLDGWMLDPYTGARLKFTKSDASAIQIDHVVPLHAAWKLGAWRWTPEQRLAFANDPRNLISVDGSTNQRKSDSLADDWRPPDAASHCVYAINTVEVHHAYGLGVTRRERNALTDMLDRCD